MSEITGETDSPKPDRPPVEAIAPDAFRKGIGQIAEHLKTTEATSNPDLNPSLKAWMNKMDTPTTRHATAHIKTMQGRVHALETSLAWLGQGRVVSTVKEDLQKQAKGESTTEDAEEKYAALAIIPQERTIARGIEWVGQAWTLALVDGSDPKLVEKAKVNNSQEQLQHAEIKGQAEGYHSVLEKLNQGNQMIIVHEDAERLIAKKRSKR